MDVAIVVFDEASEPVAHAKERSTTHRRGKRMNYASCRAVWRSPTVV